jgi:hemerythrin-like domain-containing protein
MLPTEELKAEHEDIRRMLAVVGEMVARMDRGQDVDADDIEKAIDFIRNYADGYHHAKEEDLLFPAMYDAGFPKDGGPVAVMLGEHDEGRAYVGALAEATARYSVGDTTARAEVAEYALSYAGLLDQHIEKENQALYPMADGRMEERAQTELRAAFDRVSADPKRQADCDRCLAILEQLSAKYLGS